MRIGESYGSELVPVTKGEETVPGLVYQLNIRAKSDWTNAQTQGVLKGVKNWLITPFYVETRGKTLIMQFEAPYTQQFEMKAQQFPLMIIEFLPQILQGAGVLLAGIGLFTVIATVPKWVWILIAVGIGLAFGGPYIASLAKSTHYAYTQKGAKFAAKEALSGAHAGASEAFKQARESIEMKLKSKPAGVR